MDPKACFERLNRALEDKDIPESIMAAGDLLGWLLAGGYLPSTTVRERELLGLRFAQLADHAEDCLAASPVGSVVSGDPA